MAEQSDSTPGKKRRVIHWNPEADQAPVKSRWSWKRVLGWTVGGFFGLLIAAGVVIRVAKLVLGPQIFQSRAEVAANAPTAADANLGYISETKAEFTHETAAKGLAEIRRLPRDHPVQLQRLILIEKAFQDGESLLAAHEFAGAYVAFTSVNGEIDAFSRNVKIKQDAQQADGNIQLRMRDLEIARTLAPGILEATMADAAEGRRLLNDGNFTGAKEAFDHGFAELKKAEQALSRYVQENLLRGEQALTKGQKDEAAAAFNAVLEKAPGNEVALRDLKRAETIDRVHALLLQGESLEQQHQYALAAESYQKAFALDGFSAAAQAGQARANRLEKETRFGEAFSAAQAAFKRREWPKAIAELENALKVYPQKPDVQAMLKSARENAHTDAVKKALTKGYAYENDHQWKEAIDAYRETMQLEPENTDAKEGLIRSSTVIRALLQFNQLIENSEQLAKKAEFQAAIREFGRAMDIKPNYRLPNEESVKQLHALLQSQSTPVEVTFKSDGKTWFSITNYRLPSQMVEATVKMFPGDYSIVGRRAGYRDVLMLLQVRNGTTPPTVTVECTFQRDRT
jgi:tetratricopeptide (TPR) repeat protein